MRVLWIVVALSLFVAAPAVGGKNSSGALIVHTDDSFGWRSGVCGYFDTVVPQECELLNTRTDYDENTPATIWFIAAFDEFSDPGVTSILFGNNHNLPPWYHNRWGWCGPYGSEQYPAEGWPDDPENAGNQVLFGSPIVGDRFFPFYYAEVWGFEGAYYGTAPHPALRHASFLDDSNPPIADVTQLFGQVRWYEPGYNVCPGVLPEDMVACCQGDGSCLHVPEAICPDLDGESLGPGTDCDPNHCPQGVQGVCCLVNGECLMVTPQACVVLGGTFFGEEHACDPNPCLQPPEAACCLQTGQCLVLDVFDCEGLGGSYLGEGVTCDPNPCFGACCYITNVCEMLSLYHCEETGGTFEGAGSDCNPNPCPYYDEGVCCLVTGECDIWTEPYCVEMHGVFRSGFLSCDPNPCYGACCFYNGDCQMLAFYWCIPYGGEFMGADTDCDPNPCVTSAVPEILIHENTWGTIKARYR